MNLSILFQPVGTGISCSAEYFISKSVILSHLGDLYLSLKVDPFKNPSGKTYFIHYFRRKVQTHPIYFSWKIDAFSPSDPSLLYISFQFSFEFQTLKIYLLFIMKKHLK